MSQTVIDTKSLEERVNKTDAPRGGFYLQKGNHAIPLPWMLPFWANTDKKPYLEIAGKLDSIIDKYYELIGKENTYLAPHLSYGDREGTLSISHINMEHYGLFVDTSIGTPINREMANIPDLGYIKYDQDNKITMKFEETFKLMVEKLLGKQINPTHEENEFVSSMNNINTAIDTLFITQGLQPTPDKKHNLIGLYQNLTRHILEKEEIQKLIGITPQTIALDNPNLIRLANQGVTHTMIRIFCIAGVFPSSTEELEDLANLPIEMLHDIWIGREAD